MKISAHIITASDEGDSLRVEWQGSAESDGRHAPMLHGTLRLPPHAKIVKAYHVGRNIEIDVRAK